MNSNRFGCTKDCKDRHPGCHGSCEKYHEAKQKYLEGQREIREKRYRDANYEAAHRDAVGRCLKSR